MELHAQYCTTTQKGNKNTRGSNPVKPVEGPRVVKYTLQNAKDTQIRERNFSKPSTFLVGAFPLKKKARLLQRGVFFS